MKRLSPWRCLLTVSLVLTTAMRANAQAAGTSEFSDEAVAKAIELGKEALWRQYDKARGNWEPPPAAAGRGEQYPGGYTALAALALLSAGESYQDPRMQRALKYLAEVDSVKTYVLGLRAQVWSKLPQAKGRLLLKRDVDRLINSMCRPVVQKPGPPPAGQPARAAEPPPKTPEEALKRNVRYGTYGYTSNGKVSRGGDHSNTQFGILGVWGGAQCNLEIPSWYWKLVFEHFRVTQNADGGWGYSGYKYGGVAGPKASRATMTAAGLASMFVAIDNLFREQFVKCGVNPDVSSIQRGLAWYDRNFTLGGHYGMYAIERVGLASGYKYFGKNNWYKVGASYLIRTQRNGQWGSLPNSCFAMLFLVRGRAPVLFNRLAYEGDWNNRPRALANLMRWTGKKFEHETAWQIINLQVPVDEWHDAPILLMTGAKAPKLKDADLDKIREFVWQGGTMMTIAECGRSRNAFDRAWRGIEGGRGRPAVAGLYAKLFPGYELKQLPPDHPIYNAHFKVRGRIPMWGVSNGIRILAYHTNSDLPLPWQINAERTSEPVFQLAFNIVYFTTDRASLRGRGTSPWPAQENFVPLRVAKVARVKYNGNWDPEPLAWERFARLMGKHWQTKLVTEVQTIAQLDVTKHRLAAMTGTGEVNLTAAETNALKAYLVAGGTLVMDAAGGSKAFGDSAAKLLEDLFEDGSLRRLSSFSEIYQMKGLEIGSVAYRRAALERFGEMKVPRLQALTTAGRPVVILSAEDLTSGLAGYPCYTSVGYKPGTPAKPGSAEKLMRNIVFYGIRPTKTASK